MNGMKLMYGRSEKDKSIQRKILRAIFSGMQLYVFKLISQFPVALPLPPPLPLHLSISSCSVTVKTFKQTKLSVKCLTLK